MKTLTSEHLARLQAGRAKSKKENGGLVCNIDERISIWADQFQFILRINGATRGYYHDIDLILEELMTDKAKELMIVDQRKNLESVLNAITSARAWLNEMVAPALSVALKQKQTNAKEKISR